MNEIKIFENPVFGSLKTIVDDGKAWFVGREVAEKLGYANPQDAIRKHCKGVREMLVPSAGGTQMTNCIPEGDIYRLIIRSKLPSAERFETWVCDEILPSIHQTGSYTTQRTPTLDFKRLEAEARLNNSRARIASEMRKWAELKGISDSYKQILASKAAEVMTGNPSLSSPERR